MSTPNPALVAAAPSLIAALQAVKQFIANLGTDPALVAAKLPGALQVLIGTVELQLPVIVTAEIGVVAPDLNTKLDGLIGNLQNLGK